jgi:integrase
VKSRTYDIRRPAGARKTYGLTDPGRKAVEDARIDRVNEDLMAGVSRDLLEARMRQIKADYDKTVVIPELNNLENSRAAEEYLAHHFSERLTRRPHAYRWDILQAVRECGTLSLYTVSQKELQAHINKKLLHTPLRHRRTAARLNAILIYLKRGFALAMAEDPESEIAYIGLADFKEKILQVKEPHRCLVGAAFATGARLGELFAMEKSKSTGLVYIGRQWSLPEWGDVKGRELTVEHINKKALLKNKKKHYAFIIPELEHFVDEWLKIPEEKKEKMRLQEHISRLTYKQCKKVFNLRFHDMRHSYAVHLGVKGFSTTEIGQFLGDDDKTVRKYYLKYIDDSGAAERYAKIYKGG